MTKKQRQKINNARKRRYRSIVNLTGNSKLASKLRGWSDKRIYELYGLEVKKRTPKIHKPKEAVAKRNLSKALIYYEAAQKTYLKKKRAAIQEDYEDKVYDGEENHYDEEDKVYDEESFISNDYESFNHTLRSFDPALNTQGNRRSQWKYWSNKYDKFMPQEVKEIAEWLNEKNGYDINGHYGYAVVYYAYLYGVTIEEAEQIHKADKFEGGNIYSIVKEL